MGDWWLENVTSANVPGLNEIDLELNLDFNRAFLILLGVMTRSPWILDGDAG